MEIICKTLGTSRCIKFLDGKGQKEDFKVDPNITGIKFEIDSELVWESGLEMPLSMTGLI